MKIVLCVKRDILGSLALNRLVRHLAGHELSVLLSDKVMAAERAPGTPADQLFFERDLIVDHLFPALDAAPPDNPQHLTFRGIAREYGIPVDIVDDINAPETVARLRDLAPDLMLSNRFDLIFKAEAIAVPRLGLFNLHPGALPQYRGLYAPFRALMNKEARMGCTLHAIDPGIDTGPVVDIAWIEADPKRSVLWHYSRLYVAGADRFARLVQDLEAGRTVQPMTQDETQATYYRYPDDETLEAFRKGGGRLVDTLEYREMLASYSSTETLPR